MKIKIQVTMTKRSYILFAIASLVATQSACMKTYNGRVANRVAFDDSCMPLPQFDDLQNGLIEAEADWKSLGINFVQNDPLAPVITVVCTGGLGQVTNDAGFTSYTLGEYNYLTGNVEVSQTFLNDYPPSAYHTMFAHELFHAVGGYHVSDQTATMYYGIQEGGPYNSLNGTDAAQTCAIYPGIKACDADLQTGSQWPDLDVNQ